LPPRFLRFFNTLYIPELEQESINLIFSEITKGIFRRYKLKSEVMELIDNKSIVNATLSLYEMAKLQFLPTPSKSHYLFNMRDVSKVIQGLSMIKASSLSTPDNLVKLWVHEFQRVFEDRLINEDDKKFIRD
jgi:dynein heavy chain